MVFLLIALSRLQGFLAHWREFSGTELNCPESEIAAKINPAKTPRIIRPTQIYLGETGRRVFKL